jgi:hypothetical protein
LLHLVEQATESVAVPASAQALSAVLKAVVSGSDEAGTSSRGVAWMLQRTASKRWSAEEEQQDNILPSFFYSILLLP